MAGFLETSSVALPVNERVGIDAAISLRL